MVEAISTATHWLRDPRHREIVRVGGRAEHMTTFQSSAAVRGIEASDLLLDEGFGEVASVDQTNMYLSVQPRRASPAARSSCPDCLIPNPAPNSLDHISH